MTKSMILIFCEEEATAAADACADAEDDNGASIEYWQSESSIQ
jgi:hypothetical protein